MTLTGTHLYLSKKGRNREIPVSLTQQLRELPPRIIKPFS
jgi:hypothetical protein